MYGGGGCVLGLQQYAEIAGVLMEVLPWLLPTSDSQVTSLVMVVRAESNNGFDLLWRVLELTVPGFDPALQISARVWFGDDIFDFCLSYVLYFCLQAKKGLVHDERTKSLTLLQAVREPAYVDVITTLQAHIDTYLSKLDFGYLPPNLWMMGLAAQMNKNVWAWVCEVLPRVARWLAYQDGWHPLTPEIQVYHLPRVFCTENPQDRLQYGTAGSHTPDRRLMDVTAVGLNDNPLSGPPVVSTVALPVMVPGAGMLGLITIADSGIQT